MLAAPIGGTFAGLRVGFSALGALSHVYVPLHGDDVVAHSFCVWLWWNSKFISTFPIWFVRSFRSKRALCPLLFGCGCGDVGRAIVAVTDTGCVTFLYISRVIGIQFLLRLFTIHTFCSFSLHRYEWTNGHTNTHTKYHNFDLKFLGRGRYQFCTHSLRQLIIKKKIQTYLTENLFETLKQTPFIFKSSE